VASFHGAVEVVEGMWGEGAKANPRDRGGRTLFHYAAAKGVCVCVREKWELLFVLIFDF
jgi:hypothetical protein